MASPEEKIGPSAADAQVVNVKTARADARARMRRRNENLLKRGKPRLS